MENMTITQTVAKRIKEFLLRKEMSQYRLEKITAIHHGTMSNIMAGKSNSLNLKTVLLICKGLGVTPSEFFDHPSFTSDELDID